MWAVRSAAPVGRGGQRWGREGPHLLVDELVSPILSPAPVDELVSPAPMSSLSSPPPVMLLVTPILAAGALALAAGPSAAGALVAADKVAALAAVAAAAGDLAGGTCLMWCGSKSLTLIGGRGSFL